MAKNKTKMLAAVQLGHRGGKKGGPARARVLSPQRRSAIAAMGAAARGKKNRKVQGKKLKGR